MRIDTEVMSITSCTTSGNPRTCVVVRGVDGTTKATHAIGANVQLIWDYLTLISSDEGTEPVVLMSKVPVTRRRNNGAAASISDFNWEFDDSASRAMGLRINQGFVDTFGYVKNIFMLRKSGTGGAGGGSIPAEWSALFIKPTVNGN